MQVRLEHRPARSLSPLTPWVHTGVDGPYYRATVFDPPLPHPVHGKGYPVWFVEHRGRTIHFVSPQEIAHAIDILGRKILPVTRDLGKPHRAVNSHWLSRLHSSWKPWKVRQELVRRLKAAMTSGAG
jgi:hypothetical protein